MKVAAVVTDLMLFSRIESAAAVTGAELLRVDRPADLPSERADLVLLDWSARDAEWAADLERWRTAAPDARIIPFGPHTDLEAHAAARVAGVGPMWARSKLLSSLQDLLAASKADKRESEGP